jgi:hypothetical protein
MKNGFITRVRIISAKIPRNPSCVRRLDHYNESATAGADVGRAEAETAMMRYGLQPGTQRAGRS